MMTNMYANDSGFHSDLDNTFKCKNEKPVEHRNVVPRDQIDTRLVQKKIVHIHKEVQINALDEESRMGHFGWPETKNDVYSNIPYILRKSEKYFSTRMIEMQPLVSQYLKCVHKDLYTYYTSLHETVTEAEARLLNEINKVHCDDKFGSLTFTTKSTLVKVHDAYELFVFLDTCYRKLTFSTKLISNKVGFIQSQRSSIVVPFVNRKDELYMPLFCFENVNDIEIRYISEWDLAYLRFCCIYQGIWKGSPNICAVISLSDLKAKLPTSESQFDVCWPMRLDHGLLLARIIDNASNKSDGLKYLKGTQKRKQPAINGPRSKLAVVGAIQRTSEAQPSKKRPCYEGTKI